ncbi:hypothetical protein Sipo8835_03110 [Streptomyces ipomoeae]|uniref:Uncharacterized protein n=1 Tax=Streptomyces ipomoeae TaxID=103232 RepID=A0AAE8W709_9ACTN|nr:hypothetical protein [Streptomyces ipomoeae]TQE39134.1 hypothetical protein Sipo8835_03110 [Streptomyces ipomoeae]
MLPLTEPPAWAPFNDEPLFVPELLLGADQMDTAVAERTSRYLRQVAVARGGVLHLACAWNALHFGFDLALGAYHSALLDPECFHAVRPAADAARSAVPVGAFIRIERGTRWLWAEAVGKFGASRECDDDGWMPAARSGDRAGFLRPDGLWEREETLVVDTGAFGPPSAIELKETARLRRSGLLDTRGHLTSTALYQTPELPLLEDAAFYQRYLLGEARPLLATGPLAGLIDDPHDTDLLDLALAASFETIADLLRRSPGLRTWGPYAVTAIDTVGLPGSTVDEVAQRVHRARTGPPRYTAIWPLLCAAADAAGARDLTEGTNALVSQAVVNLAIADRATQPRAQVDLRIDDLWQQGGIWRAQQPPVPWYVDGADPLEPLGVGHREHTGSLPATPPDPEVAPVRQEPSGEPCTPPEDTSAPALLEETAPDEPVPAVEHLDDSLTVYTCCLLPRHIDDGTLPLPTIAREDLPDGPFILELHHDDDAQDPREPQEIGLTDAGLTGVAWPWSFYPGIRLTVTVPRGGRRLHAITAPLDEPLHLDGHGPFSWDCDIGVLRRHLGLTPQEPERQPPAPRRTGRTGYAPAVDSLCSLVVAGLRRHGTPGLFDARSMRGDRLSAALFGPGPVPPQLMWTVIHTCEDMADRGLLERETGAGEPDLFIWWPGDKAPTTRMRPGALEHRVLRNHVKAHYVPPDRRKLPSGRQASDHARVAYARWRIEMLGPDADTTLPEGYTFVRGHRRGTEQPPSWHDDLSGCT